MIFANTLAQTIQILPTGVLFSPQRLKFWPGEKLAGAEKGGPWVDLKRLFCLDGVPPSIFFLEVSQTDTSLLWGTHQFFLMAILMKHLWFLFLLYSRKQKPAGHYLAAGSRY